MPFPWRDVTWVLLDMDGTLLDKHYDDYFWETLGAPGVRPAPEPAPECEEEVMPFDLWFQPANQ